MGKCTNTQVCFCIVVTHSLNKSDFLRTSGVVNNSLEGTSPKFVFDYAFNLNISFVHYVIRNYES